MALTGERKPKALGLSWGRCGEPCGLRDSHSRDRARFVEHYCVREPGHPDGDHRFISKCRREHPP